MTSAKSRPQNQQRPLNLRRPRSCRSQSQLDKMASPQIQTIQTHPMNTCQSQWLNQARMRQSPMFKFRILQPRQRVRWRRSDFGLPRPTPSLRRPRRRANAIVPSAVNLSAEPLPAATAPSSIAQDAALPSDLMKSAIISVRISDFGFRIFAVLPLSTLAFPYAPPLHSHRS